MSSVTEPHVIPAASIPALLAHWGDTLGVMESLIDAVRIELREIKKAAKKGPLNEDMPPSLNGDSLLRMDEFIEFMAGLDKGKDMPVDPTLFRDAATIMAGLMTDNQRNRIDPEKKRLRPGVLEKKFRKFYYEGAEVELDAGAVQRIEKRRSEIRQGVEFQEGYAEEMKYFYDAIVKAAELAGLPIRRASRPLSEPGADEVSL